MSDNRFLEINGLKYELRVFQKLAECITWFRVYRVLYAVKRPPELYYVRVNTRKITRRELVRRLTARGYSVYEDEFVEEAIFFPIEGPFEICTRGKVLIVDKYAAESVMLGADLYAPGVMRGDRVKPGDKVVIYAPNGEAVAYGTAVMSIKEMTRLKKGLAVKVEQSLYRAPKIRQLKEYQEGLIYDQSLPAMVAVKVAGLKEESVVVDLCAAPGGKATFAAQLAYKGVVYAIDRSPPKVAKLREHAERLGLKNIRVLQFDSRRAHRRLRKLVGKVDVVILDPPCTSIGVRPKVYDLKLYKDVSAVNQYQRQFLEAAYQLLKPGGVLMYSTCTVTVEENEEFVKYALQSYDFTLEKQTQFMLGEPGCSGLSSYVQRFFPDAVPGPGFFIAKLVKNA